MPSSPKLIQSFIAMTASILIGIVGASVAVALIVYFLILILMALREIIDILKGE